MAMRSRQYSPFGVFPAVETLADIGIFGGSGFYSLLDSPETIAIETPYGAPSDLITLGTLSGKRVAFLPRHGSRHQLSPSQINYRANVWAFKALGCHTVISPCAAGSLQPEVKPGDVVICDQYVDRTYGKRADTFYEGPLVTHMSAAYPFDETLRQWAIEACKENGIAVHAKGTVVIIPGPRFSTHAESLFYRNQGWEVINMTQYPEVHLVKELNMYSVNLSLITDYDSGVDDIPPVSHHSVLEVLKANNEKLKLLLKSLVEKIPAQRPEAAYLQESR
jgi:5'-methylthioadenosine phosphorylase